MNKLDHEIVIPLHDALVIQQILGQVAAGNSVESFGDEAAIVSGRLQEQLLLRVMDDQQEL